MLGRICQHLSIIIYLPGDTVIKKGEIGQELFILTRGTVEIVNEDLTKRTKKNIALNRGAVFGEIALMMDVRRTSTVCAKTMCELSVLAQHDFDTILLEAPEFAAHMKALVIRRQVEILVSRSSNQATRQDVLERVTVAMNSVMDKKLSSRLQARSALLRTVTEKQLSKIEQALVESVDDSVAHSENKSVQSALVDSTAAPALRPLSDRDVLMEQR
jgi:CRP-like cAMP-binding protein